MFLEILLHTPRWVFIVLAVLVVMGVRASRPQRASLRRCVGLPLALAAVSLLGTTSAFGTQPAALLAWALALAAGLTAMQRAIDTSGVRYAPDTGLFALPGSWLPLALMMAIFAVKFGAGVVLAVQPQAREAAPVVLGVSAAYGLFSGLFLGRAMALWAVARRALRPALAA
ncbi:MAG: hypothetical protein QM702_07750 [Rubrivivax sp.]